ncbi:Hint domain-containing protein [Tabrizicola sp. DMG-N-6]|uniref:Hint domain-containing protein n=2 Tax=Szabonella alba TaxID=2804194 RepID=A0A8K0VCS6_9RHOB|nr:Hint domain-containing protein [Szabonella alba]
MRNDATLGLSNGTITCFASGTLIKTISGEVPIESLWVDDLVLTVDRGYRPIRWIRSRKLDSMDLRLNPDLRPIRIRTGALGGGMPEQDLMISPQHRVLVNSRIAESMFGTREVLVAARQLLVIEGIDVAEDITELDYWHFLFDDHEIVFSNGAKTESLYTGAEALESIGSEARKEIFTLFPDLEHRNVDEGPRSARPMIRSRDGRRLAQRHVKNQINLGLNG